MEGMKKEHIEFVDLYMTTGYSATSAYMEVYPDCSQQAAWSNASRLLRNDSVKNYLDFKKQELIDKLGITKEKNLKDLEVIKAIAMNGDKPQLSAANQAIQIQNKMLGLDEATKVEFDAKGITFNIIEPDKRKDD